MTKYARLFKASHDLTNLAVTLPSPYVDYVIAELERLYRFTDKKLDQILKREKENKNV